MNDNFWNINTDLHGLSDNCLELFNRTVAVAEKYHTSKDPFSGSVFYTVPAKWNNKNLDFVFDIGKNKIVIRLFKCLSLLITTTDITSSAHDTIDYDPDTCIVGSKKDDPNCYGGTYLAYLRNAIYCNLGFTRIYITDASRVKCGETTIDLFIYRIFSGEGSWYRRQGFTEVKYRNQEPSSVEHIFDAINKSITKVREYKLDNFIEYLTKRKELFLEKYIYNEELGILTIAKSTDEYISLSDKYAVLPETTTYLDLSLGIEKFLKKIITYKDEFKSTFLAELLVKIYAKNCAEYVSMINFIKSPSKLKNTLLVDYKLKGSETNFPFEFYDNLKFIYTNGRTLVNENVCSNTTCTRDKLIL